MRWVLCVRYGLALLTLLLCVVVHERKIVVQAMVSSHLQMLGATRHAAEVTADAAAHKMANALHEVKNAAGQTWHVS